MNWWWAIRSLTMFSKNWNRILKETLTCIKTTRGSKFQALSLYHKRKDFVCSVLGITSAAAAKSLQLCPTLCDPIDGSPPGSPVPGILQARTLEWVAISFSNAWKWKWSRSVVSDSYRLHGLQPTRLLRPWDFPGKSTGMGCHCLLYNKAEVGVFLELLCFFNDPMDVGSLISGSSASLNPAWMSGSSRFTNFRRLA